MDEREIARRVLNDFRKEQLELTQGIGCLCSKCIEAMRIALKKNKMIA
jgi:bacterioferritin-associated ferredoxin